jgi:hypothetical protein
LRRPAKSLAKKWATRSSAIKSRNAQGICEMGEGRKDGLESHRRTHNVRSEGRMNE